MRSIIISYRENDTSKGSTHRLYDNLCNRFGEKAIVLGISKLIQPGDDFEEAIVNGVEEASVLLVVIGDDWTSGGWLAEPSDYDRLALSTALKSGKRVIPVAINDAQMPQVTDLPEDIRAFARRVSSRLREDTFRQDAIKLLDSLNIEPAKQTVQVDNELPVHTPNAANPAVVPTASVTPTGSGQSFSLFYRLGKLLSPNLRKVIGVLAFAIVVLFFSPWVTGISGFTLANASLQDLASSTVKLADSSFIPPLPLYAVLSVGLELWLVLAGALAVIATSIWRSWFRRRVVMSAAWMAAFAAMLCLSRWLAAIALHPDANLPQFLSQFGFGLWVSLAASVVLAYLVRKIPNADRE